MSDKGLTSINLVFDNSNELGFTILPMMSDDYKERFRAEFKQLDIRTNKLSKMLDDWIKGKLKFDLTCDYGLLYKQLTLMDEYRMILRVRAQIEGIDLHE